MTLAEFSSLQRAQSTLPFLIAAFALALVVLFPLLPPYVLQACADTLFAALVFHGVLAAGYPLLHTLTITVLSFAQAGIFQSATERAGSIWLGLAVYCIVSAATNFVRHRDARRVMALGAALSLAQLLDPMGPVLAVFLLPLCVGLPREGEAGNKAGLLALLLFSPSSPPWCSLMREACWDSIRCDSRARRRRSPNLCRSIFFCLPVLQVRRFCGSRCSHPLCAARMG